MTSPTSLLPRDVPFKKALSELPQQLRDALVDSELADPGILMSYQRSSSTQLGLPSVLPSALSRRRQTKKGSTAAPGTQLAEVRRSYVRSGTDMDVCRGGGMSGIDITVPLSCSSPLLPLSPSSSTPPASVSKPGPIIPLGKECVEGHDSEFSGRMTAALVDDQLASEAQGREFQVEAGSTDDCADGKEVSRGETPQSVPGPMPKSSDEQVQSRKRAKKHGKKELFAQKCEKKEGKSKSAEVARQVGQMEGRAQGPGSAAPFQSFPGSATPFQSFPGSATPFQSFPGSATPSLSRPGSATPSQSQPGSEIPSLSFHGHDIPSQSFTPELGDLAQSCAAQHSDVSVVTSEMVSCEPGLAIRPSQSNTSSISELTPFSDRGQLQSLLRCTTSVLHLGQ